MRPRSRACSRPSSTRRGPRRAATLTADAFRAALSAAAGRALGPDERLGVAVSGGPDSLALLWLAARAYPGQTAAATVDHGLRVGSAAEAAAVAVLCRTLGVPHATLTSAEPRAGAGLQAAARTARYALLAGWCAANGIGWLATAHHRDDQAETLLMRLTRGAGVAGLAGARVRRPLEGGVTLLRPLLGLARGDLAAVTAAAGWTAVDDAANHDPRHERTRIRAVLAGTPALDPAQLAASAAHLADAEAALAWAAGLAWASRAEVAGDAVLLDAAGLPPELARRLLARGLAELARMGNPPGAAVAGLLTRLQAGRAGTLGGVRAVPGRDGRWRLSAAPPHRAAAP